MKKIVLMIVSFLFYSTSFAQWSTVNVGTTQDLYSIDYYTVNDIWIGSYNQILKSSNGGSSWSIINPIKDNSNVQVLPANMNDLALTSTNTAIGTGFFYMGNTECILTTTNGGANWNQATVNNSVPLLRYINSVDVFSNRAVAVGNNGRIATSSNSGSTWSFVTSGTTNLINDVKFISIDTVIAAGNGIILKSLNGGTTWIANTSFTTSLKSLSCKNNVVYIGTEYDNTILKSTNYGVSYTTIQLPFNSTGNVCAINKDTLLVTSTNGLYVSKTGGQYWEKYILPNYKPIKMIDYLTPNNLIAVGDLGYVIKTSNLALAQTAPINTFNLVGNSNKCLGDSIILNNTTAPLPGYSYTWKINNTTFSSQYNTGIKPNIAGTYTISLSVTNTFTTITNSIQVVVTGHELNPFSIIASTDTICFPTPMGLGVLNSQTGVSYKLRNGFQQIQQPKTGDGSTLEFTYPYSYSAPGTYTLNIEATLNNGCFTDSLMLVKTFVVAQPTTNISSYVGYAVSNCVTTTGITNVTFNTLNNSSHTLFNRYFNYACCKGTVVKVGSTYPISITSSSTIGDSVGVWIDYNNDGAFYTAGELVYSGFANPTAMGSITIGNTMLFNQKLRMRVISSQSGSDGGYINGCGQVEDYYIIIQPGAFAPTANFIKSTSFISGCTTSVTFTNTSYNAQTISWHFSDGLTSTITPINHNFNTLNAPTYTITLTACNSYGCDSVKQTITFTTAPTPILANCNPTIGVCSNRPVITQLELPQVFQYQLGGFNDYTCTSQIHLLKDSLYQFKISTGGSSGAAVVYADLDKDGNFTPSTEAVSFGSGQYSILGPNTSGLVYFQVPNYGIDSVPLRMRVIIDANAPPNFAQNCCNVSCGDYKDFTLYTYPHKLQTFFSTPLTPTLCATDSASVYFTNSSKGATSYLWSFGDGKTSILKEPTHTYTTSGQYTVKLITSNGITSDSLTKTNYVTIHLGVSKPSISLAGATLSTTTITSSYQWLLNTNPIIGATAASYSITQDGYYQLNITNSYGCNMSSLTYSYYPLSVNFFPSPDTICVNDYFGLGGTARNANNFVINWGDGHTDTIPHIAGYIHTYTLSGSYSIKLKGCNATTCDSLTQTVFAISPPNPITIQNISGILSTTTTALHYQWYYYNTTISGATSASYTPTNPGDYQLIASNAPNCNSSSSTFSYYPLTVSFSADTLGYCGTNYAIVDFMDATPNGINYNWDFGDGANSTQVNPIHTYTNSGVYTIKLKVCNSTNCDSLIKTNYITVSNTPVTLPVVSPSGTIASCYQNQVALSTYTNYTSYQWQGNGNNIAGATNYSYSPMYGGEYNIVVTNSIGCILSANTVTVNYDYDCVWPGDVNNDAVVDNLDVLELGLHINDTGPSRIIQSNNWQPYMCSNWTNTLFFGNNEKMADCDGDGVVTTADTLAIFNNYNLTHAKPLEVSSFYNLTIVPDQNTVNKGTWGTASIYLGDFVSPVSNIYGVAFTVYYDNTLIQTNSVWIEYPTSFLNANNHNLHFRKLDFANSSLYTATTHTNNISVSGYGKIATLHYKIKSTLASDSTLNIGITGGYETDSLSGLNNVYSNSTTVLALGTSIVTNNNDLFLANSVSISPNPTNGALTISSNTELQKIEVLNVTGQLLLSEIPTNSAHLLQINNLANGIYLIQVYQNNIVIRREKIVLNK